MTSANCPTCGGPIEFKIGSSFLVVCPHCKSAIARTDRELKDLGKVAALVDTESPLSVGLAGKYFGKPFRLTGRAQLRHTLGGVWDEWYAAFDDGRWGWLAEAQGRFYMTFEAPLKNAPSFEQLKIGEPPPNIPAGLVVSEIGEAYYTSAEGEIPFPLVPGEKIVYSDLSGANNLFGTLDYSDEFPIFYAGREVTLQELSLNAAGAQPKAEKRVAITNLACPNCGGSLELRAPDETERVGCPYCGSLLDASEGRFSILQALKGKLEKPLIPLGAKAEFEGVTQTVIGFFVRSCVVDKQKYYWREYLLYNPQKGFRWLVHSDAHWTFVKTVGTADVKRAGREMIYQGVTFKRFQDAPASVELVLGECYWKVTIGETVTTADFIAPPRMLSSEQMTYSASTGGEINWSLGEYVPREEIQTKFKLASVPRPSVTGACQPNPHKGYLKPWLILGAATFALTVVLSILKPYHIAFTQKVLFEPLAPAATQPAGAATPAAVPESGQVFLSEPFELQPRKVVTVKVKTSLDNSWLELDGDLINEDHGEIVPFDIGIEYYHGVEDGESWSEGDQDKSHYLSSVPAGKYILRLEGHWEKSAQPISFQIEIGQTGIEPTFLFLVLGWITVIPLYKGLRRLIFESSRWSESMYGGGSSD